MPVRLKERDAPVLYYLEREKKKAYTVYTVASNVFGLPYTLRLTLLN